MREIKFRGRHLRLPGLYGDWIYGSLYSDGATDNEPMIIERVGTGKYYPVVPATVGQFTGLKDCEGQEIYEGDVVTLGNDPTPSAVRWDNELACYIIVEKLILGHVYKYVRVIGNVYDSPELLEVDDARD